MTDPAGWSPPAQFEEYRIVRQLGRGGMGQVVLAEDRLLARLVAIKFIAHATPSAAARERFFVEARAAARLSHPNVVAVHRVGEIQGWPFIVSEYVRGQNLAQLPKPVPWRRALALGIDLARGLAAAHRRGVLHRDIKPANAVISEEGTVKLLDFGLAKLLPEVDPRGVEDAEAPSARPAAPADADGAPGTIAPGGDAPAITRDREPPAASALPGGNTPVGLAVTLTLDLGRERDSSSGRLAGAAGTSSTEEAISRESQQQIAGTPLYMAAEIWNGEPATARSDVYALGVVLYELCAGLPPYPSSPLVLLSKAICTTDAPPLQKAVPGVDPSFAAIVARCLQRDAALRFPDGDALREALERVAVPDAAASAVPQGNPFRGLLAFEAEHRSLFFGRNAEILDILDRLRADPFVLVIGDSGTGKSSLCRAGVLPGLAGGALDHPVTIVTAVLGRRPLSALGAALATLLAEDEAAVTARLRAEPLPLARHIRRTRGDVLLFVDQLEELCTQAAPEEAAAVAEALHALADRSAGVRVLATARSDFLTRLSALPGLGDDLRPALYLLRPLTAARLREAVTGPVAAKGFSFASQAIVETLVDEAQRAEGGLPLLQFALAELWEARDEAGKQIPASALEAIGGVNGALARHADGVLARLPSPHLEDARAILLALVTAEGTRMRRPEAELLARAGASPGAGAALTALVHGRLLVAHEDAGGAGSAYDIAHEALLSGWDTLRGWLGHDVEGRALRQRIERAAVEWERLKHAKDALWGERLLAEAAGIAVEGLGAREAAFLSASRQASRRRRLRRAARTIGVLLAFLLAVLGGRIKAAHDLTLRVKEAEVALGQARAARDELDRLRKDAFARFDAGDIEHAEKVWAEASGQGTEVERAYADVFGRLELVLQQDGGRKDARLLLADAIYERAILAERGGRVAERNELLRRLGVQKLGIASRWDEPTHLSIEAQPPGAEVGLARFVLRDGRYALNPEAALGQTPIHDRAIAPGSVVLTFSAPGRATVRLPLLLERDEARRIALQLPLEADVPEGFVYVPEGRFLYGSDDEAARQFYISQPLHPVETGAYLIARNETTYGEWIAFLRSLPSSERPARLPRMQREGFIVALTEPAEGDYQLTLGQELQGQGLHPYVARMGQQIRYKDRYRRQSQDWLRFPVTAISFEDARAYTAWLDRSGRVPGARPCTEREWERAARGADSRGFPGGERLEPDDANFNLTYGPALAAVGPDEVGSHPASDSPFGAHDLAGNVWELTSSAEAPGTPVARGGSFSQPSVASRTDDRSPTAAAKRNALYGFRTCATPRLR